MIVRSIDGLNDWEFGKGRNDYKSGAKAISQNIQTRLQSYLGDCFFALNAGIDWFNLLGSKNLLALELAIKAVILNTDGVTGIVSLDLNLDSATRLITMTYVVNSVFTQNNDQGVITSQVSLLLTEGGDILTTEDGEGLGAG